MMAQMGDSAMGVFNDTLGTTPMLVAVRACAHVGGPLGGGHLLLVTRSELECDRPCTTRLCAWN